MATRTIDEPDEKRKPRRGAPRSGLNVVWQHGQDCGKRGDGAVRGDGAHQRCGAEYQTYTPLDRQSIAVGTAIRINDRHGALDSPSQSEPAAAQKNQGAPMLVAAPVQPGPPTRPLHSRRGPRHIAGRACSLSSSNSMSSAYLCTSSAVSRPSASSTRGLPTSRWNRSLQERGLAEAQLNYRLHDWCIYPDSAIGGRRSTASAAAPGFPAGRLRRQPAGTGCRRGATPARTPTTCATARDSSPASRGGSLSSSPCVAATTVLYGDAERHRVLSELNPDALGSCGWRRPVDTGPKLGRCAVRQSEIQPGRCRERICLRDCAGNEPHRLWCSVLAPRQ